MQKSEINFIKEQMSGILNFNFDNVEVIENDSFLIDAKKDKVIVSTNDKTFFARALSIIKKEFSNGNFEFKKEQKPSFKERGIMLDMSRNGVMRVSAVKKYIAYLAAFGLNTLWLYTEDTYTLEEYPFLGYKRGRYTQQELREIDDYAYNLGVEVVPCIQTLGHMEQYLRYQEAAPMRDTSSVMLCQSDETYKFIDCAIKFFSQTLRTRKIHVGIDEANDIGTGAFLAKNGYKNRADIICAHLEKVCEICKKYNMKPLMWNDMYCRMGSKIDYHYDTDTKLDKEIIDKIPDVDMVHWDYYHEGEEYYQKFINAQKPMNKKLLFAAGIWTWDGLLPNISYTFKTMVPAMKASIKEGIESFIGTMWSDGGCETNHFYALFGLALLSEYTFLENPSEDDIYDMLNCVTGMDKDAMDDIDSFNGRFEGVIKVGNGQILAIRKGSQLVWNDILYDLIDYDTKDMVFDYKNLEKCIAKNDEWKDYYILAENVLKIAEIKRDISKNLKQKYDENDKEYIKNLAYSILPDLKLMYEQTQQHHQNLWKKDYKVFGWENIMARYLTTIGRIDYAISELKKYLDGTVLEIEELTQEKLFQKTPTGRYFRNLASTSNLF